MQLILVLAGSVSSMSYPHAVVFIHVEVMSYLQTIVFIHVEVMSYLQTSFYACRGDVISTVIRCLHAEMSHASMPHATCSGKKIARFHILQRQKLKKECNVSLKCQISTWNVQAFSFGR